LGLVWGALYVKRNGVVKSREVIRAVLAKGVESARGVLARGK